MIERTCRNGGMLRDMLKGEVENKRPGERVLCECFPQIIREMGCETFTSVKK